MVKIVLALVIILAVGSGVLSLRTKGANEAIRNEATEAKQAVASAEAARKKAEAAATEAAEQAAAAAKGKEDAEAAAKTAAAEAEKAKGELATLSSQVTAKEKELAELKAKAEAAPAVEQTPAVDLAELENKLKEAQTKLEEQQQVAASLESKSKAAEQRAATLEEERERRLKGVNAPGLEGKILAVDGNWNFVVLSIGDRQGVAPNSTLLVKRGATLVGKVRVTSVDPSTSIANIIPSASPKGSSVRPGDVVIFSGS